MLSAQAHAHSSICVSRKPPARPDTRTLCCTGRHLFFIVCTFMSPKKIIMCVTNIDQCEINFLIEPNENDVVYAVVFLELYAVLPRGTI